MIDDWSFFLGWSAATFGYFVGQLWLEARDFLRWHRKVAEARIQAELAADLGSKVIASGIRAAKGEYHVDPPKDP